MKNKRSATDQRTTGSVTVLFPQRLIALAGDYLERLQVNDFDHAARVAYLAGDLSHRCPANAEHLGKEFLRSVSNPAPGQKCPPMTFVREGERPQMHF